MSEESELITIRFHPIGGFAVCRESAEAQGELAQIHLPEEKRSHLFCGKQVELYTENR